MSTSRRRLALTAIVALGGLALFAYAVGRAGVDETLQGIRRVGWGLVPILGLAGLRFVVRSEAWRQCAAPGARLPRGQALMAFLAGDALGNVTPAGLVASEPTKVFLIRHHLATREAIASLAIDNVIYAVSIVAMMAAGTVVALLTIPLPLLWQQWGVAALALVVVGSVAAGYAFRANWFGGIRESVTTLIEVKPFRLWRAFALDMVFHALAVLEIYLTLGWLLGTGNPTLAQAFIFETLNRAITVAFKFVPLLAGVDEAVSGWFAPLVGVSSASAVSLAVVRKVRKLFWAGAGLAFIGVHHAQAAPATDPRENARAHRT